jgi:hypothetical protein
MTERSLDSPLAVYAYLPSGDTAIPHGRRPTGTDPTTRSCVASTTETRSAAPTVRRHRYADWLAVTSLELD